MRYIDFVKGGTAEQLSIAEVTAPIPTSQQVLVKVHAFGVNRADTLQRQGKYPPPKGESDIIGLEMSGEIIGCGEQVKSWRVGDKVFGLVAGGGYAEYVAVNADHIMAVPGNISLDDAAGIAEVFLTAYQSLFQIGQLQAGQKVLIHAGASGVGLAAIQLAKASQCEVVVTASSKQKLERCAQIGADTLINYKQQNFADVIKSSGKGIDLVIDFVGGDYLNRNLSVLNMDGGIVYLAMLAGRYADKLDMALLLGKRAKIVGSTLRNRSDKYKAELVRAFSQDWLRAFETEQIKTLTDSFYRADDIASAHQKLEENLSMGKLIGRWD